MLPCCNLRAYPPAQLSTCVTRVLLPFHPFAELGRILIYEAVRDWLPTVDLQVQTPVGLADATVVDPMQPIKVCNQWAAPLPHWSTQCAAASAAVHYRMQLCRACRLTCWDLTARRLLLWQVVPILRAGLLLLEQAATLLPVTQTYHVGYVRSDETLEVSKPSRVGRAALDWR